MQNVHFDPMDSKALSEILGLTIKKDDANKLTTFLCQLSAYSEDDQFNLSFNAPSSTGKSYIPTEIAKLFPPEDVLQIGYCSPTAFFHDVGKLDKDKGGYVIDLSRKILIFLDQPHNQLLAHLRPLFSHDQKELQIKITDKAQKGNMRTKNVIIKGFPAAVYCSAGLRIDEQESTRFILLSPEIDQEKIRFSIEEKIKKEVDHESYKIALEGNADRRMLKERILAIREAHITEIKVPDSKIIQDAFFSRRRVLKPRHQRDIGRLISIIKAFTLLNFWHRERDGDTIIANHDDIQEALAIFGVISESQEYNLPPYIYDLYQEVIVPAWEDGMSVLPPQLRFGITRQEILKKHFEVNGKMLDDCQLRQQVIPMLESSGLITQEQSPTDKRQRLIRITEQIIKVEAENNSESHGGGESTT